MIRNREVKMVVLIATALALGVGVVAAYVVPWFYCKPSDDDDEKRDATGPHEDTRAPAQSGSIAEKISASIPNIRIRGFNYIKVMVPPTPPRSVDHSLSTTTMQDSATLNMFSEENSTIQRIEQLDQANDNVRSGLQFPERGESITSVTINTENARINRTSVGSARNVDSSEVIALNTENVQRQLISEVENPGVFNSALNMQQSLSIINEENVVVTLPSSDSSNPTDESSTESTDRASSVTSDLLRIENIGNDQASSESEDFCSKASKESCAGATDSESILPSSSMEYSSSRTLTTSGTSNPTDDSSTETTSRESTSQESENSSSGPTKVLTNAIVESSKVSSFLETIPEVSTSPPTSVDPSARIPGLLTLNLSRINATSNLRTCNDASLTPTPRKTSSGFAARSSIPTGSVVGSPDSTQSTYGIHLDTEVRKKSKSSRYAVFNRIRNILRGGKFNAEAKSSLSEDHQEFHQESIKSLSAGEKIPTGHSTLIPEDQRLLESIRSRRSPQNPQILKVFEDPRISDYDHLNYLPQFGSDVEDEPLDLSIRSSPDSSHKKADNLSTRRKSIARSAEVCKELFREVAESLRSRRSSKSSEEGSSMSCDRVSKTWMKDENGNVTSDSRNGGNLNVEVAKNYSRHSGTSKIRCLPKTNELPRKIKKILHIGGKERSNKYTISESVRKGQVLNSVPVELLRYSAGTSSQVKSDLNAKVFGSLESPTDLSSYREVGFSSTDDDEKYRGLPCTDL